MSPKNREEIERLPSWQPWKRAEEKAKKILEKRFGKKLSKGKLVVGKLREFDLISSDKSVIVQVKSSEGFESQDPAQHRVRFAECMLDCIMLEKASSEKKIFVIASKPLYDFFIEESKGLVSPDIDIILIELED